MPQKLTLQDTPLTAITKLSEGNPGAISVIASLFSTSKLVDPDSIIMGGFGVLLNLDQLEISGSDIWVMYKDICKEDIIDTHALIRAAQLGVVSREYVRKQISSGGSIDMKEIKSRVQGKLPEFGLVDLDREELLTDLARVLG